MAKTNAKSGKASHEHHHEEVHIADHKFCAGCGSKMHKQAHACPKCGLPVHAHGAEGKSNITAGILALFLGGIGIHKFYLNKPVQGIFYILFSWTFIPSFIALIEGIIYLTATPQKWQKIVRN